MKTEPEVLLSVPALEWMWSESAYSLVQVVTDAQRSGVTTALMMIGGAHSIAAKRNASFEIALAGDYTHVMFFDSDMVTERSDLLLRLLSWEAPIIGASCFQRIPPFKPARGDILEYHADGTVSVSYIGTAALLIRREVLEQVLPPWFEEPRPGTGSDVHFCEKAREAGFDILMDTTLEVKHMATLPIGQEERDRWK